MQPSIEFAPRGPFDDDERAVIRDVATAIGQTQRGETLIGFIQHNISLLDRLGNLLSDFPSLFAEQRILCNLQNKTFIFWPSCLEIKALRPPRV